MENDEHAVEAAGKAALLRLIGGDMAALDTLVELYRESLLFFIGGYVRNIADAEELMIDTFYEFVLAARRFRFKSSVKTFLFSIGRNVALSYVRKHRRELRLVAGIAGLDTPEAEFLRDERSRQLHLAIKKLKGEYREVLYLLYFEDMSYRDAAVVLRKNVKQIANLSSRARESLRDIMESEGFGYV
jgi:RNA polymerase sigma-70 factor (ECF subfamily)